MRSRFVYLRPGSTSEAVAMQQTYGPDAKYLAGATDLYLDWKNGAKVGYCIDISHLRELDYLNVTDGVVHMGALTSLRTLEFMERSNYATDVLAKTATVMCTPQTRSLATVGGNLCNASPAADLAPPLLCLDATVSVTGANGPRTLTLTELFKGVKQTSLDGSELLLDVAVPLRARARVVSLRATRTALDIALVIASVLVSVDDNDVIDTARIAFGAVSPIPLRVPQVEALLVGRRPDEMDEDFLHHVVTTAASFTEPIDDLRTTAAYRRSVSATLLKRALVNIISEFSEMEMAS